MNLVEKYLKWTKIWEIDVALRYHPIVKRAKKTCRPGAKILEVGAGGAGITAYWRVPVTAVDLNFADDGRGAGYITKVTASADAIPFPDDSFDFVISVDMMEHLPAGTRAKAIGEFVRVTRPGGKIFIAVPCGRLSAAFEKVLNALYKARNKKDNPWLAEHIAHGLPDYKDLRRQIVAAAPGAAVKTLANVNVFMWFALHILGSVLPSFLRAPLTAAIYPAAKIINFLPYRRIFVIEKTEGVR
ncbi:MAG: class I SAM-dependent methyltransferase [Endomicrobiia bacterium]|nr:class I SAM-dependent methyltransferase [Endomicrobiia bacterium]